MWPSSLSGEDIEGFITCELHWMGSHARSKTELEFGPCLRTNIFNRTFSKQKFC